MCSAILRIRLSRWKGNRAGRALNVLHRCAMPRGVYIRTPEYRAKISAAGMGHKTSEETRDKIRESLKKHFDSKGHITRWRTYGAAKELGLERKCAECGAGEEGRLCIHHIDGDIHNIDKSNLIILCTPCHSRLHFYNGDYKIKGGAHA